MTDNLEQLERDWPTRRPKDIPSANLWIAFAILWMFLAAANAVISTLAAKWRHADLWQMWAFFLFFGIATPLPFAIGAYGRVKAALVASHASPAALAAVRLYGAITLGMVYIALTLIIQGTIWLSHR